VWHGIKLLQQFSYCHRLAPAVTKGPHGHFTAPTSAREGKEWGEKGKTRGAG